MLFEHLVLVLRNKESVFSLFYAYAMNI